MKNLFEYDILSTSYYMKIAYYALKAILYLMIGYIVLVLIIAFIVPEFSGYKEKFEFKEVKTGKSVFLKFPNDPNITHFTIKIKGNISEDVDFVVGGNLIILKLKKNSHVDTTYEGDFYDYQVELRTICYKKCIGTLKGSVKIQ